MTPGSFWATIRGITVCRVRGHRPVLAEHHQVVTATGDDLDSGSGINLRPVLDERDDIDRVVICRRCWQRVGD